MKAPLEITSESEHKIIVKDTNGVAVFPEDVCREFNKISIEIDNAAAGPWEKGPVPDGEKGDKMLFLYIDSYSEDFRIGLVKWSVIAHGWWMRAANATAAQPDMFARVNIPKVEKRKGEKNDDNTN